MTLATLILLLVFTINTCLLIFIIVHPHKQLRWQIFLMVFLISLWQGARLINSTIVGNDLHLLAGMRLGLMPALFLPAAFTWLAFSLLNKWSGFSWWKKFAFWLAPIVMSLFIFTDYNLQRVLVQDGQIWYIPGALYWWFAIYFLLSIFYDLYILVVYRKNYNTIIRRQIDYIFVGAALAGLFGLLFSAILPIFGVHNYYFLGLNGALLFTIILTYSLFRYRFFDLKISFYTIIIDSLRLFILGIIYYILCLALHNIARIDFSVTGNLVVLLVFMGLSIPFVFKLINFVIRSLLIDPTNDLKTAEDNIASVLRSSQDFQFLFSALAKEISRIVDYREIFVYLSKRNKPENFYQVFPVGERLISIKNSHLLKFLKENKKIANAAEIDYLGFNKLLTKELKDRQIDLVLPIFYDQQLLGVMIINNNQKLLSIQQLNFLEQVNKYLDIAVGSLLLHQQCLAGK
ncbi:MAG: hypothetical protein COV55_00440 [Candidatus Komeilibacteria bacterium CG11_big_fil_rev_8_21_14_0_20_36_20]|uniref:Histidine kinase N-terminal 7TM region domain-containing protein n=1 Tax=Candidatus Komeilibacteria bacterium CG11_big_fil_rev_8_21_14_0_20_36_20 TaxID=1974477 RepID=A0A2H0NGJ7_9BACT|nr:MAG: hypothetical protein COV55_00440 [Candidatus Komeilibacteria bacterium CG11_big_fil_rev_8_21_14_0_20_36_20]PIR81651.1 MAG: hypothetical protein COU21_02295 [Candidatus Komeilibacteria bacterium CG10_big_fil_rev_8_21_14_0_10_36_65]